MLTRPQGPCGKCGSSEHKLEKWLLVCATCKRAWHQCKSSLGSAKTWSYNSGSFAACRADVSQEKLTKMIEAAKRSDTVNGLQGWVCSKCYNKARTLRDLVGDATSLKLSAYACDRFA
jgi:hypothetical protein